MVQGMPLTRLFFALMADEALAMTLPAIQDLVAHSEREENKSDWALTLAVIEEEIASRIMPPCIDCGEPVASIDKLVCVFCREELDMKRAHILQNNK